MKKEIVINASKDRSRIAIVENGDLVELYVEHPDNVRTLGNIYLAKIRKIMPGIRAAFVDIGQKQDAFLHFSDLTDNLPALLTLTGEKIPGIEAMPLAHAPQKRIADDENEPAVEDTLDFDDPDAEDEKKAAPSGGERRSRGGRSRSGRSRGGRRRGGRRREEEEEQEEANEGRRPSSPFVIDLTLKTGKVNAKPEPKRRASTRSRKADDPATPDGATPDSPAESAADDTPKKKPARRSTRSRKTEDNTPQDGTDTPSDSATEETPKKKPAARRSSRSRTPKETPAAETDAPSANDTSETVNEVHGDGAAEAPATPTRSRSRSNRSRTEPKPSGDDDAPDTTESDTTDSSDEQESDSSRSSGGRRRRRGRRGGRRRRGSARSQDQDGSGDDTSRDASTRTDAEANTDTTSDDEAKPSRGRGRGRGRGRQEQPESTDSDSTDQPKEEEASGQTESRSSRSRGRGRGRGRSSDNQDTSSRSSDQDPSQDGNGTTDSDNDTASRSRGRGGDRSSGRSGRGSGESRSDNRSSDNRSGQRSSQDGRKSSGWKAPSVDRPEEYLRRDGSIPVKITKEPISSKGSRVSTDISLAGRFLVLVPAADYVAVSKKIESAKERRRLKTLATSLKPDGCGVIVRTVAEGRDAKTLDTDLTLLIDKWRKIEAQIRANKNPPSLLYEDVNMVSSIIRDLFTEDYDRILIDDPKLHKNVQAYIQAVAPHMASKVVLHRSNTPIFRAVGIEKAVEQVFSTRVPLPSGGYLFIEHTEAMHVVDVNSGRAGRGKSQSENILAVNLEAAREVAKQLRLRDLGGIIVVDCIDMRSESDRRKVYNEFKNEFKKDRAVTKLLPMSDFGLIEITRQRLRPSITTQGTAAQEGSEHLDPQAAMEAAGAAEIPQPDREFGPATLAVPTTTEEVVDQLAAWFKAYREQVSEKHRDRPLLLEVHPLLASHLRRGFPSLITKLRFRNRPLRFQLGPDPSLHPLDFEVRDEKSGKPLKSKYSPSA